MIAEPILVRSEGQRLVATLRPGLPATTLTLDGVLDSNERGEVLGLEILDLSSSVGQAIDILDPEIGAFPTARYDEEVDAFYLKLARGQASRQSDVPVTVTLSTSNEILELSFLLVGEHGVNLTLR